MSNKRQKDIKEHAQPALFFSKETLYGLRSYWREKHSGVREKTEEGPKDFI